MSPINKRARFVGKMNSSHSLKITTSTCKQLSINFSLSQTREYEPFMKDMAETRVKDSNELTAYLGIRFLSGFQ